MKVNYNAKTGDNIKLRTGMGCQGDFCVTDSYPDGVKIMLGEQKLFFSYEQLKAMDAEFCLSEIPDLDAVQWAISCYIDEPKEAGDILVELYEIVGKRLSRAKHNEDLKTHEEWLPIYQNLSHAVSQISV